MDTLIAGIHNNDIRRRLISEDKSTTLDEALAIVRAFESIDRQRYDMDPGNQTNTICH